MNIYFSGISGFGVGPLAEIALSAGYDISGSDLEESPITTNLRSKGVDINIGQDGSFLQDRHDAKPIDWFVYTSALPDDHPELVLAKQLGIKTTKRDGLIAQIINDKQLKMIAIAGTHGKTTTTGMLIWALQQLQVPISYSIGTTLSFGPSGKFDPASEYFVYECDEFDRNFLNFNPYLSIITAIDYDHPDTYPTNEDYLNAFQQFGTQSSQIICWEDQHSDLFINLPNVDILDPTEVNSNLKIPGILNRRNATLVQKAIIKLGINTRTDEIIDTFPGVNRRFEKLADNLYSDYGHHPIEIAATLQLAHEISNNIVLVYQPHQNVRQHEIRDQYTNQFELASKVYWLPTYLSPAREDPNLAILSPVELTQKITNKDHVHIADLDNNLWNAIQNARNENALVIVMGAGSIDKWVRDKLAETK